MKHITTQGEELDIIREPLREHEKEPDENICFQNFEAELKEPLELILS